MMILVWWCAENYHNNAESCVLRKKYYPGCTCVCIRFPDLRFLGYEIKKVKAGFNIDLVS